MRRIGQKTELAVISLVLLLLLVTIGSSIVYADVNGEDAEGGLFPADQNGCSMEACEPVLIGDLNCDCTVE